MRERSFARIRVGSMCIGLSLTWQCHWSILKYLLRACNTRACACCENDVRSDRSGGFGDAGDRKHGYHDTTGFAALIQYTGARFNNIGLIRRSVWFYGAACNSSGSLLCVFSNEQQWKRSPASTLLIPIVVRNCCSFVRILRARTSANSAAVGNSATRMKYSRIF